MASSSGFLFPVHTIGWLSGSGMGGQMHRAACTIAPRCVCHCSAVRWSSHRTAFLDEVCMGVDWGMLQLVLHPIGAKPPICRLHFIRNLRDLPPACAT